MMRTGRMTAAMLAGATRDYKRLVSSLDTAGCQLYTQQRDGWTALMFCASNGFYDGVKLLMKEACAQTDDGVTALMMAAEKGYNEIVKELIHLEIGTQDKNGCTALLRAIKARQNEGILQALAREASLKNRVGENAFDVLDGMQKAYQDSVIEAQKIQRYVKCVKSILEPFRHTDFSELLNKRTSSEALLAHIQPVNQKIFELLETKDISELNKIVRQNPNVCEERLSPSQTTPVMECARLQFPEGVQLFLNNCTQKHDLSGSTALMWAIKGFNATTHSIDTLLEIMQLLIPSEACLRNKRGQTALHLAIEKGILEASTLLLPFEGALATLDGKTPYQLAQALERKAIMYTIQGNPTIMRQNVKVANMFQRKKQQFSLQRPDQVQQEYETLERTQIQAAHVASKRMESTLDEIKILDTSQVVETRPIPHVSIKDLARRRAQEQLILNQERAKSLRASFLQLKKENSGRELRRRQTVHSELQTWDVHDLFQ